MVRSRVVDVILVAVSFLCAGVVVVFLAQQVAAPTQEVGTEPLSGAVGSQGEAGAVGPQGEAGADGGFTTSTTPIVTMSSADGSLSYSGSPISATLLTADKLRVLQLTGNFATVSSFGTTGQQISFNIPFNCAVENDGGMGHLNDFSRASKYLIFGECAAGTSQVKLYFMDTRSLVVALTPTSLVTLTTADSFTFRATLVAQ